MFFVCKDAHAEQSEPSAPHNDLSAIALKRMMHSWPKKCEHPKKCVIKELIFNLALLRAPSRTKLILLKTGQFVHVGHGVQIQ